MSKPPIITETPEYDPSNAYHYRKWELAGKPDLQAVDSHGEKWRPCIVLELQDDGTYLPRALSQAHPVTEATSNFRAARVAAPQALDQLKGTVWAALVAGGKSPDEATAAGVALVLRHGAALAAFEAAGGHPLAAQALYAAIASKESTAALPWLTEPVLAIFAAALTPGK